ncbi:MAG TPA: sialidase family protein, partial [Minicystis sp.]|nr:sialidase family protein [Minicystis sp.]
FFSIVAAAGCGGSDATGTTSTTGGGAGGSGGAFPDPVPAFVVDPVIQVSGTDNQNHDDCRDQICRHNENTDLIVWKGATWLVHRTAESQILGPNSALHVYRSTDHGETFTETARLPAIDQRDIRDPAFFVVGDELHMKALARLAVNSTRDSNVDTIAMGTSTKDGTHWAKLAPIGPETWSFWRVKEQKGVYYSAAYEDGDKQVVLFSSHDGTSWTMGPVIYDVAKDTPLETELTFMPSGKLLALVRMDGNDDELLGDTGRLRTKICWSDPPYSSFSCPDELDGQRLDGPVSFFHDGRLFVVARRHIKGIDDRKRTALFEITGDFDHGGKLGVTWWGDLPSAGDTSYAGVAPIDGDTVLTTWYSGNLEKDESWSVGMFDVTDIWKATLDFRKLTKAP